MLVNQKALTHRSTSRAKLPCSSQCEIPWEPDYVLGLPARNRKGKARNINIEDTRKFPVPCQRVHSFGSLESKAHTVTFHGASPFCTQGTKEIIYTWKQIKITNAELWSWPRGCETKGELISLRIKVKHYNCFGPEIKQPMTTSGNVCENFLPPTSCYMQKNNWTAALTGLLGTVWLLCLCSWWLSEKELLWAIVFLSSWRVTTSQR